MSKSNKQQTKGEEMSETKAGGFMGIKSTTKSTAEFINEQIASNPIIIEQQRQIDSLKAELSEALKIIIHTIPNQPMLRKVLERVLNNG